ncbi:MAG: hypothetical protein GC151_13085 [Betaproteobacteria bacterium]|nr:hypothetical protein [Betaproteobacteria bacterium]
MSDEASSPFSTGIPLTDAPVAGALYLRSGSGEVSGPFPRGLLLRHLELGRIGVHHEVSGDRVTWHPATGVLNGELGALHARIHGSPDDLAWHDERRRARRRWIDERGAHHWQAHHPPAGLRDRRRPKDTREEQARHFGPVPAHDASASTVCGLSMVAILLFGVLATGVFLWLVAPPVVLRIAIWR